MNNHENQDNAYHIFARFYDDLMSKKKYEKWRQLIREVIEKYHIPQGKSLDIACGTGNITEILVDLGYSVTGIDRSVDMLEVARKRFPNHQFILSDIRNFSIAEPDKQVFAVSFYDSLNYLLSDEDILTTFKAVHRNIANGAIFLFDMNSRGHITSSQKNAPRVYEGEDYYSVFKFSGEDRIWNLDIDFFVRESDGRYDLIHENHVERGYDREDIEPLLIKAGFMLVDFQQEFKMYEDGINQASRLYFIAKKI